MNNGRTGRTLFAEPLQQVGRTCVLWRGRKLSYFGGCDYFRLASDRGILRAVREGMARFGLNVAASRRTTGNHPLYEEVERATAKFFKSPAAVLVSSGYLSNIAAAQAMRGRITHALIDARAHSSLQDAATFLGCRVTAFGYRDVADLRRKTKRRPGDARLALLTDGLFAHDGSVAPLREYRQCIGDNALLWVDDAHAAGVLGLAGRGSIECCGLSRTNLLQTITFSKAFGVYGGAILCDTATRDLIVRNSAAVAGNTPLPLPLAHAILKSLALLGAGSRVRLRLDRKIALFWSHFGITPAEPLVPIIAFTPAYPKRISTQLLHAGIYPSLIQYGGAPEKYFRFAISSEHTNEQIVALAQVLSRCAEVRINSRRK